MYVEEIKNKQKNKTYVTVLIRETYRKAGKVLHRTLANISKLPRPTIEQIKRIITRETIYALDRESINVEQAREYGAVYTLWQMAKALQMDTMIYSRSEQWRNDVLAMIVGRLVYQGSKLSLTNLYDTTALWELAGHESGIRPDVETHCYEPLDRLLERQAAIQKALAKKHLQEGCMILYDITSSYVEGDYTNSELVAYGYNRDGKRGHEQIVIGLLTNQEGCPVAVEVFKGNTSDQTTVLGQAKKVAEDYGVKSVVFAGDRGMLTPKRIEEVTELGYKTLTALTHPQIRALLEKKVIQLGLFDERNLAEVRDPDQPNLRYVLSRNPIIAEEETTTRQALISKATEAFEKLKNRKKKQTEQELSAAVGKILGRYKVGKFFEWKVDQSHLEFSLRAEKIEEEKALDGCYIIRTDVAETELNTAQVRQSYKQLAQVEKAFRNLKTVSLEMRPIYHHTDDRIRAHIFLCMLAYYVQWHMVKQLQPLFESDGKGKNRRWSLDIVLNQLKAIRKTVCTIEKVPLDIVSTPSSVQQKILDLLNVSL